MSESAPAPAGAATTTPAPKPPMLQLLYDDVWFMLVIGLVVPMLFYTVWGAIELMSVPMAK